MAQAHIDHFEKGHRSCQEQHARVPREIGPRWKNASNAWRERWNALKEKCALSAKAWTAFKTISRGRSTMTRDAAIPGFRRAPIMHLTSMPRDPLAPDFGRRINKVEPKVIATLREQAKTPAKDEPRPVSRTGELF